MKLTDNQKIQLLDIFYMKKAINIAKKGQYTTQPNPNVGCVIVNNNQIVGIGWHKKYGLPHAEVNAINMAGIMSKNATAYISLEPCSHFGKTPPCCRLLVQSGIKRVVIAMIDPNPLVCGKGIKFLKKSNIQITIGVLSEEAKKINKGFIKRIKFGIPWIQVKIAMSIDGKIALKNGESQWITSKKSIQDVHKFRGKSSAILSTSNTILKDNSKFTVRYIQKKQIHEKKNYKHPLRIIIDSKNQITPNHNIIKENISNIWLIRIIKDKINWPKHVQQIIIDKYKNYINFKKLLQFLGKKKINILWIECGSHLFSNILNMKLIDEIILYISPKMLGNTSKSLYLYKKKIKINNKPKLIFQNIKLIKKDIRIILKPRIIKIP